MRSAAVTREQVMILALRDQVEQMEQAYHAFKTLLQQTHECLSNGSLDVTGAAGVYGMVLRQHARLKTGANAELAVAITRDVNNERRRLMSLWVETNNKQLDREDLKKRGEAR